MQKKVVVIGGGISGLTTAYQIKMKAHAQNLPLIVQLIEKEQHPGGKIKSIKDDQYLYEWGPNGFLDNKPETLNLCEKLGITDKLLISNDNTRKRFIYSKGQLYQLPQNPREFITCRLLGFYGKLRIMAEAFIPKYNQSTDESLAAFAKRRFGHEAYDKLIAPMANGIFAGDPETMALKSCFPRLYEMEQSYGSLITAMRKTAQAKRKTGANANKTAATTTPMGKLTSFRDGLQTLTDNLVDKIGQASICHSLVKHITKLAKGYEIATDNGEVHFADVVISAVPSYAAANLFMPLDSYLSTLLQQINYVPLVVVNSVYNTQDVARDIDGFGYLLARGELPPVLGTLWESSIFAHRAPEGKILLRTMLGGAKARGITTCSDTQLKQITRDTFAKVLGIKVLPEVEKIVRHQFALPEYTIGHSNQVAAIMQQAALHPGVFITGNAFNGVSVNDCIASAYALSTKVIDYTQTE